MQMDNKKRHHFDPEYSEWHVKFPTFPGIEKCLEIFNSRDLYPGSWQDVAWMELTNNAVENLPEYLAVTRREVASNGQWAKGLLWMLAHLQLPECRGLFEEMLQNDDPGFREYGAVGMKLLEKQQRNINRRITKA